VACPFCDLGKKVEVNQFVTTSTFGRVAKVCVTATILLLSSSVWANEDLLELEQDPNQWVMPNQNYAGWNHSALDQITTENVQDLELAWTFQTGVTDSHEAEPLIIGDTMYIVTPKPNTLYALDLTQQGRIIWSLRPEAPNQEIATERGCCGAQTRGLTYAEGKLFFNTLDGRVFAVEAETGEVVWSEQNADLTIAETMAGPVLVVGNNAIVGIMGGEYGVRGHITAYDINTGERKWRMYSTGPDEEMGIGPRFKPFYADDKVDVPGVSTWYEDSWERGGGTVWGWFTYDPESNLFYYGTGNCGPWNPDYRRDPVTAPGLDTYTNKYCASLLARDATTGELVWAYSLTPQDQWDLDEPNANILIDLEIDGEMRKALVRPARNGFFYVFDRLTGELLQKPWKFTSVTWAKEIDMKTGRPVFDPERIAYTDQPVSDLCPWIAARNWENDAYSPQTGLVYFTGQNRCVQDYTVVEADYVPGAEWTLQEAGETYYAGDEHQSKLNAVNPATGEVVWQITHRNTRNDDKPVLSTAGGLLFQGTDLGTFRAIDAQTGEIVWRFRSGSDYNGSPVSYTGPDGKQYIAIISSSSPDFEEVTPDTPPDNAGRYSRAGSTLYVFSLPTEGDLATQGN
jgi:PQQ-dependent dehydrogenase (methanol/ethanol family)